MKSQMSLKNTFSKNLPETNTKKFPRITVVFIIIIISVIAIVLFASYSDSKAQSKYVSLVDSVNKEIVSYNTAVQKYRILAEGLNQRQLDMHIKPILEKETLTPNYDLFVSEGSDYDSLDQLANSIRIERNSVESQYKENCTSIISSICEAYNDEVNKYNSVFDRLKGYENLVLSGDIKKEKLISPDSISFTDNTSFFYQIDGYISDKNRIDASYYSLCLKAYNDAIMDYNLVAEEYNKAVKETSIDFIKGLSKSFPTKKEYGDNEIINLSEDELCSSLEAVFRDTDKIIDEYLVVTQITNPSTAFVYERLEEVDGITGIETVSMTNDPNQLMGKEGGYVGCLYFAFKDVDSSSIPGTTIVDKGTDAGGAVEIYKSLDEALARCDYLSQFDGTLLYSGSYAIIGTMVVRTSYKLDNKQQVDLTNDITKRLTELTETSTLQ